MNQYLCTNDDIRASLNRACIRASTVHNFGVSTNKMFISFDNIIWFNRPFLNVRPRQLFNLANLTAILIVDEIFKFFLCFTELFHSFIQNNYCFSSVYSNTLQLLYIDVTDETVTSW